MLQSQFVFLTLRGFRLLVLVIMASMGCVHQPAYAQQVRMPDEFADLVEVIDEPTWWVTPFAEGNTSEGKLYFATTVENLTEDFLYVGMLFRVFDSDGRDFPGCHQPLNDEGSGTWTTIAPHAQAKLICRKSIVPTNIEGLQLIGEIVEVERLTSPIGLDATIATGIDSDPNPIHPSEESVYYPYAMINLAEPYEEPVNVVFRLYDEFGIQVDTCSEPYIDLEWGINQRVECFTGVIINADIDQPVRVSVEIWPEQ